MAWPFSPPAPTTAQLLAAVPVRNQLVQESTINADGLRLTGVVSATAFTRLFGRKLKSKSFDLDSLGMAVWRACDGHASVEEIIREFAEKRRINLRAAQVSVCTFLHTLLKRNLIALQLPVKTTKPV